MNKAQMNKQQYKTAVIVPVDNAPTRAFEGVDKRLLSNIYLVADK